ncbi:unnamed protein product [Sympodiomycopsis kandeliae]
MPINRLLLQILTSPLSSEWSQHQPSPRTVTLDEKRRLVHGFRMEIARWKQDANCLKSHRAMPLIRTGHEDFAWESVSFKARVILRIAEERLAEAQQSMIAEADQQGLEIIPSSTSPSSSSSSSSSSSPSSPSSSPSSPSSSSPSSSPSSSSPSSSPSSSSSSSFVTYIDILASPL